MPAVSCSPTGHTFPDGSAPCWAPKRAAIYDAVTSALGVGRPYVFRISIAPGASAEAAAAQAVIPRAALPVGGAAGRRTARIRTTRARGGTRTRMP